jgi:HPt (histidine-containing phosphotransfer) domain-containing protein
LRKEGCLDGVFQSISDITHLETARRENERNTPRIGFLQQRSAFEAFVQDAADLLYTATCHIDDAARVRHLIATVKGNAGALGGSHVVQTCHEVESAPHVDEAHSQRLHTSIRTFLDDTRGIVDIPYQAPATHMVLVSTEALGTLSEQLYELDIPQTTLESARSLMLRLVREFLRPSQPWSNASPTRWTNR